MVDVRGRLGKGKTVGCQFDDLWNHLQKRHPDLTIGAFQDALRKLHNAGRIRGWRLGTDARRPSAPAIGPLRV